MTEMDDDDRWFYNDDLYMEYIRRLPPLTAERGGIRFFKGPDLSNLRSDDA